MKKIIIIIALVFLLAIAGIFIATQERTNRQSQQKEQVETERLRDRLQTFTKDKEQYDLKTRYKVVENAEDAEMQFLNLTEGLKTDTQHIGTDVIWTAISSSLDTLKMTIHLHPTSEEWLGVIDVKMKKVPDIRQINLYEAVTSKDTVNYDIMVRDFQRKNKLAVDGIVGKGTWSKLQDENARQTATLRLTEEDFKRCAEILGVEVAAVKAVQEVETGGRGGFFAPGRPAILFEGHIFWSQLKKHGLNPEDYVKGNEDILYPKWTKSHYKGGIGEYERLKKALAIHEKAAACSASWGLFQIMGFNYAACGCKNLHGFSEIQRLGQLSPYA